MTHPYFFQASYPLDAQTVQHESFLLPSNTSRTSVDLIKNLVAHNISLKCSLCGSYHHVTPLRGCCLFWVDVFPGENPSTRDGAVGLGGKISSKVRVIVTSSPVLDTDLARWCKDPGAAGCRNYWKGVEGTTQPVGGGWE